MSWFDLLKNQMTAQGQLSPQNLKFGNKTALGLNLGEMTEDSIVEEEESCLKRVLKIIKRLEKIEKEIVARTGFIKEPKRTIDRNRLDYEHYYVPKERTQENKMHRIAFDVYSVDVVDEAGACEMLENIDFYKKKPNYFSPYSFRKNYGKEWGSYKAKTNCKETTERWGEIYFKINGLSPEMTKEFADKITRAFDV